MHKSSVPKQCDIAIVGGGLVGMSLALLLAQQKPNWQVVLLDDNHPVQTTPSESMPSKSMSPLSQASSTDAEWSFDGRSTALAKGSQTLLASLGVWDELQHRCASIQQILVSDQGRWAGANLSAEEFKLDALGYVAENTHFTHALRQRLVLADSVQTCRGISVQHAVAAIDADDPQRKGYRLRWQSGEEQGQLHTKLLLLADGAQSPLRAQLGIDTDVHDYQQSAVVANIRVAQPHRGRAFERFTPNGPLALLPLPDASPEDQGRRMALVWTHSQADIEARHDFSDAQWQAHLQQVLGERLGQIEHLGQRQCYPLRRVVSRESIRSHLVVMGNAAHFLHPVAGQGFNLALRDAARLAQRLAKAWRDDSPANFGHIHQLKAYPLSQARDQQLTISGSHGLVKLFGQSSWVARTARSIGLWEMEQMPWLKRAFALHTLGLAPHQLSGFR